MPFDPNEFKIAQGTLQQGVLEFFKQNRFSAYSAEEVFFELGLLGLVTTFEELEGQLRYWTAKRRLFTAFRDGELYYWYDNRLGY